MVNDCISIKQRRDKVLVGDLWWLGCMYESVSHCKTLPDDVSVSAVSFLSSCNLIYKDRVSEPHNRGKPLTGKYILPHVITFNIHSKMAFYGVGTKKDTNLVRPNVSKFASCTLHKCARAHRASTRVNSSDYCLIDAL